MFKIVTRNQSVVQINTVSDGAQCVSVASLAYGTVPIQTIIN